MIALSDLINFVSNTAILVLLILVLVSRSRLIIKFLYAGVTICIIGWSLSLALYYNIETQPLLLYIGRFNFAIINIEFVFLYFFTKIFPNNFRLNFSIKDLFVLGSLIVVPITLFTDLIGKNEIALTNGQRETEFGSLYIIHLAQITLVILLCITNLILNYKKSSQYFKVQIRYFALGLITALIFGLTTNTIFPLLGVFAFQQFGPIALLIFFTCVSFVILKHRFLSINIILGKSLGIILLSIFTFSSFYFVFFLENSLFGSIFIPQAYFIGIPIAISFSLGFNYINRIITEKITPKIINPYYDPKLLLTTLDKKLEGELDLDKIIEVITENLLNTINPEFLILKLDQTIFEKNTVAKPYNFEIPGLDIAKFKDLFGQSQKTIILEEELSENGYEKKYSNETLNELKEKNVRVIIQISLEEKIFGYTLLGPKDNDLPLAANELEFVEALNNLLCTSLDRALLYKKIRDFNQELQKRVDETTKELKLKYEELQNAYSRETDMLDILGHELRTPLSIAKNAVFFIDDLKNKNDLTPEKINKYLEMAKENLVRETKLLETMLSTTKIDNQKLELRLEKVDLIDVINDSLDGLKEKADKKGLTITLNKPAEAFIFADRVRFQEVVDNLIDNAIKYTEQGGVTISIKTTGGPYLILSIKDTGKGIPKEDIYRLGKKFYRVNTYLESSKTTGLNIVRPGGTGLGLYVTFNLIRLMNGKINVESEVGRGSEFIVEMPAYNEQDHNKTESRVIDKIQELKIRQKLGQQNP